MLIALVSIIALFSVEPPTSHFERLENGLRVAIVEDHTLPLVSVQLWFAVGSASDDPENPGLCHLTRTLLEHRDDAALRLRAAGVRCESRTLRDACCFHAVLPPEFLDFVLRIEARRLTSLKATPELLAASLAAARVSPNVADRRLLAAMLPRHPYRHPPGVVSASLAGVSPTDVERFSRRWFVPGNATLVIVGDVRHAEALTLVHKRFDALPWAESPPRAAFDLPPASETWLPMAADAKAGVDLAWLTPPAGVFENAAIDVLMHRLCNPVDGPLAQRLTELDCRALRWGRETWGEAGVLVLSVRRDGVTSEPEAQAKLIVRAVREALSQAVKSIPSEIEHNRARALAGRDVMRRQAAFSARAWRLGWHEMVTGDLRLAEFQRPRLAAVAVADVQQAARELLAARAVYLPRKGAQNQNVSPPAQATRGAAAEKMSQYAADAPRLVSRGAPGTVTVCNIGQHVRLTVCALPDLEPVEVRTLLSERRAGERRLIGSTVHSPAQFRDYVSYHGLDLEPTATGWRASGAARYVAQMIELQAELARYPLRGAGAEAPAHVAADQRVDVLIVGDVQAEDVRTAAAAAWRLGGTTTRTRLTPPTPVSLSIEQLLSLESAATIADWFERDSP